MYNGLFKIHDLILKFLEQRKALRMTWIAHYYDAYEHFPFAWRSTQAHTAAYYGLEDRFVSYLRTGQPSTRNLDIFRSDILHLLIR
jgi:hypothetical protein